MSRENSQKRTKLLAPRARQEAEQFDETMSWLDNEVFELVDTGKLATEIMLPKGNFGLDVEKTS